MWKEIQLIHQWIWHRRENLTDPPILVTTGWNFRGEKKIRVKKYTGGGGGRG